MFATDGYINKDNAGITLANEKLIDDIQFLLNTCGIYSRKRRKTCKKFVSWEIIIPKDMMQSLIGKIYVYQKQQKLRGLTQNKILDRGNISVMYPKQIFKNLKPTGERGGYNRELHVERYTNKSLKLFEKYVIEYPELERHRYKDFYWEEIIDIKPIKID